MQDIHRKTESVDPLEEYVKRADVLTKADYDANYRLIITAKDVRNIPAADVVEVKHGEWIKHDCLTNDGTGNYTVKVGEIWVCSVCGRDEKYREPYCHCGAKMDGECR